MLRYGVGNRVIAAIALVGLIACTGQIGDARDEAAPGDDSTLAIAAPARARRLSRTEIVASIHDALGVTIDATISFPSDSAQGSFDNQYATLGYTSDLALALQAAGESAGSAFASAIASKLPCSQQVTSATEQACLETFLSTYGKRVYRRPLRDSEHQNLVALFNTTRANEDFTTSIATVVESTIQSPAFIYRTELGAMSDPKARMSGYEVAAALSYFLTRSTPDDTLLAAAASGSLDTTDGITSEARRLLADARAHDAIHDFFTQWLELTSIQAATKGDPAANFDTLTSMRNEALALIDRAVWTGGGFNELLTSARTRIDKNVAAIYGVTVQDTADVDLDPTQRAGILTQPAFITTHTPGERSPVTLGHFVRAKFFCQVLPPPPAGVPPVSTDPTLDVHARYSKHSTDPNCSSCHHLMDPIGFGFSQYDVVGRFSPIDHGITEDGAGELTSTDVDGPFKGPVELAQKIARSDLAHNCFTQAMLSFALGRNVGADAPGRAVATRVQAAGFSEGDILELMVAVVSDDSFVTRDTTALEVLP